MSDRIRSLCSISEKTAAFCKRSNQTNHCCSTVFFPKLLQTAEILFLFSMHNSTCFSTYYPYSTNYGKYIAETGGIFHMKATGIVRRIDDLGRVVVPKEIRRTMRIREGQAMEIYTGREGEIILKKYSPIEELAECAAGFTKSISTVTGCLVCVSDQEQIVAANGPEQKNYLGLRVPVKRLIFQFWKTQTILLLCRSSFFRFSPPVMPSVRSFSAAKTGSPCWATRKRSSSR